MPRRGYAGAAKKTTLALDVSASDASLLLTAADGWPSGSLPFFIVIDRGTPTEEKILVGVRNGLSLQNLTRAADGTGAFAHVATAIVEHVWTATDANESNQHINSPSGHGSTSALVGVDDAQTLRNKVIDGDDNTFRDIPTSAVKGLDTKQASQDAAIAAGDSALAAHKASTDHNGLYFTEAESDARFVNKSGDVMSGNLVIERAGPALHLHRTGLPADTGRWSMYVGGGGEVQFATETDAEAITNRAALSRDGNVEATAPAPTLASHLTRKDYVDGKVAAVQADVNSLESQTAADIAAERPIVLTGSLSGGVACGTGGAVVGGAINVTKAGLYLVSVDHGFYNGGAGTYVIVGVTNPAAAIVAGTTQIVPNGQKVNVQINRLVRLGTGSHNLRAAATAGSVSSDATSVAPANWSLTWMAP